MRRSILKLFAAGVLIASTHQVVYALISCAESSDNCRNWYAGCPWVMGFPPAMTMFCLTSCDESAEVMYSEQCEL